VIIADLVMSLDNVIGVAAAAKGSLLLLVFGLVISIPLVVVGAQLIMKLVERLPWLVIAGADSSGTSPARSPCPTPRSSRGSTSRRRRFTTLRR
jgi:hypothetical protein